MTKISEQGQIRREKLKALRDLGIDPYPAALFTVNTDSKSIKENFSEGKKVIIAGRLMSRRIQGKASFAELQDSKEGFNSILIAMKFVGEKTKHFTMKYIRNY